MKCKELSKIFIQNGLTFFSGVPDSTFSGWMNFLDDQSNIDLENIVACNECEAVAVATGYHLATRKVGVVYMQNAGLGKAVNPLTSLCDREVYSIPLIMLIGWRGKPGEKDEPQHKKMGRITIPLLEILEIPHFILPAKAGKAAGIIKKSLTIAKRENRPVALVIKKNIIENYPRKKKHQRLFSLKKEEAIQIIVQRTGTSPIISTTGKISRELYETRLRNGQNTDDFYMVGSMGCAASIALGYAREKTKGKTYIFDGDGSVLMEMGTLSTMGHYKPKNLVHVVLDNESYESTGGQPTNSPTVNLCRIASGCGYLHTKLIRSKKELNNIFDKLKKIKGPIFLVIKVSSTSRTNLGRPASTPIQNKINFMNKTDS